MSTAAMLNRWLEDNSNRLSNRFQVMRVNDWGLADQQGIALDLEGEFVWGRVVVWPQLFADFEAIDARTSNTILAWSHIPFSTRLLDDWLIALENSSVQAAGH